MHYGSGGNGSPVHLACALFNATAGISGTHVPYRGTAPVMQDLIAGRLDYSCPATTDSIKRVEAGQLKGIALLSRSRSALVPTFPTAHEQGLADFEASGWSGIFAPKDTPAQIIQKFNRAAVTALDTPAVQARFRDLGVDVIVPERRSPEYLRKFVESEIRKWAAAIKAAGIAAE
jgi:tripartite-type tricarboxylate transporter receptor subunit TctC